MTFAFRPAVRQNTPLIIGLAGPTKSGKTYSAHRLAQGLAQGGVIAMLNAEGARGHQYADKFKYVAADIENTFSYERYTEALHAVSELKPSVLIIDSASHAHDGPGGMLEQHDAEVNRMAGTDWKKRERVNFAGWIKPKADENKFIYTMLGLRCAVILCLRAKEKLKIVPGKDPVDLGWQPIASDRLTFETIFTLVLPPHSKGVPDLAVSEMREPFDTMVPKGQPIDERLGKQLREWAQGQPPAAATGNRAGQPEEFPPSPRSGAAAGSYITADQAIHLDDRCKEARVKRGTLLKELGVDADRLSMLPADKYNAALAYLERA